MTIEDIYDIHRLQVGEERNNRIFHYYIFSCKTSHILMIEMYSKLYVITIFSGLSDNIALSYLLNLEEMAVMIEYHVLFTTLRP